ncbi:hypothetical protein, partial [Plasmodium yoelii yoelii]
VNSNITTLKLK